MPEPPKIPTAEGSGGSAATVDPLATQTAIDVLRSGGNAVDAAVAAAGVLGVIEPFSCGIGGGGFMVIYDAQARPGRHDRLARDGARPTQDRSAFEQYAGGTAQFQLARVERPRASACPAPCAAGRPRSSATAPRSLRTLLQARRADRPRGLRHRRDVRGPGRRTTEDVFDDFTSSKATYLNPDGSRAAGRLRPPQPGHGRHLRAHRRRRRQLLRGPDRARHRAAPCSSRRRWPDSARDVVRRAR